MPGEQKMGAMIDGTLWCKAASSTGTYGGSVESSFTTTTINLGLRPKVKAWGGEMYAGAGLNILLPVTITQELSMTGASAIGFDSGTIERKFGMSIAGLYGELGYNYDVMPNLYVGGGVRTNFNTGLTQLVNQEL